MIEAIEILNMFKTLVKIGLHPTGPLIVSQSNSLSFFAFAPFKETMNLKDTLPKASLPISVPSYSTFLSPRLRVLG